MMYDGIINKPPLEEVYLEHGWLKDQAAKVHKYIERHRGKNGKWIYKYKRASMPEMINMVYKNRNNPLEGDEKISRYLENRGYMSMDDYVRNQYRRKGKRLKTLGKIIGLDINLANPRQNNRGYTNSGSASAKLSSKYAKGFKAKTPFEREFEKRQSDMERRRKEFEITKRFNEHMRNKQNKEWEKHTKKFKKEMEQRQSDFEKAFKKSKKK